MRKEGWLTWTLLKCYKVNSSFKSICACFLVLHKWKLGSEHPHSSSNMIYRHTQQDSFPGNCWDENRRYMQFIVWLLNYDLPGLYCYCCRILWSWIWDLINSLNSFIEASAINAYSQFNSAFFFNQTTCKQNSFDGILNPKVS